jgi:hypothetical protein
MFLKQEYLKFRSEFVAKAHEKNKNPHTQIFIIPQKHYSPKLAQKKILLK